MRLQHFKKAYQAVKAGALLNPGSTVHSFETHAVAENCGILARSTIWRRCGRSAIRRWKPGTGMLGSPSRLTRGIGDWPRAPSPVTPRMDAHYRGGPQRDRWSVRRQRRRRRGWQRPPRASPARAPTMWRRGSAAGGGMPASARAPMASQLALQWMRCAVLAPGDGAAWLARAVAALPRGAAGGRWRATRSALPGRARRLHMRA
jgi:hypothetical protein